MSIGNSQYLLSNLKDTQEFVKIKYKFSTKCQLSKIAMTENVCKEVQQQNFQKQLS